MKWNGNFKECRGKEKMEAFEDFCKKKASERVVNGQGPMTFEFVQELSELGEEVYFVRDDCSGKRKRKQSQKLLDSWNPSNDVDKENDICPSKKKKKENLRPRKEHNKQKQEKVKKSQPAVQKEAQECAIKAVARSMLPALPGGFAAQFCQTNGRTEENRAAPAYNSSLQETAPINSNSPSQENIPNPLRVVLKAINSGKPPLQLPSNVDLPTYTQNRENIAAASDGSFVMSTVKVTNTSKQISKSSVSFSDKMITSTLTPSLTPQSTALSYLNNNVPANAILSSPAASLSQNTCHSNSPTALLPARNATADLTPSQDTASKKNPRQLHFSSPSQKSYSSESPNLNSSARPTNLPGTSFQENGNRSQCGSGDGFWTQMLLSDSLPDGDDVLEDIRQQNVTGNMPALVTADVKAQVVALQEENQKLKRRILELERELQTKAAGQNGQLKVPPSVYDWMKNIVQNCDLSCLDNSNAMSYTVAANLNPSETGAEKTKLLSHKDLLVDRAGLRKALSQASKHGPLKLLHGVIRLVFTPETLANSCGKGIRKTVTGKPPLDTEKCNDCEDFMRVWCDDNKVPEPDDKDINNCFTNEVTYAREKLGMVKKRPSILNNGKVCKL